MSGNVGVHKKTTANVEGIHSADHMGTDEIIKVKDLKIGDTILGLDENRLPAECTVEAVGLFGYGTLYGNYTEDHFVLDTGSDKVQMHGPVGDATAEDKYELLTSCPVGVDESGKKFTPIDSDFCGDEQKEMSWSDYLLIHASILRLVRESGAYWFSGSSYVNMAEVKRYTPNLCRTMLECAKDHTTCSHFEDASQLFVENALTHTARRATDVAFSKLGRHRQLGSVSAVVSKGRSVR